ncbi:hypothetical protein DPMN_118377 [Dreissena polymorpha]|uniref:Uncharacterized protein n=1 Tax=Dreissena polymorpha TaxID=45954 RepID=A0A9D4GK29_DREPO|nr:hypothetical protein DPMN_118377 [Dreissena polymorpha]
MYDYLRSERGDDESEGHPNELTVSSFSEMLLISHTRSNGGGHDGHVDMCHVDIVIKSDQPCPRERIVSADIERVHSIKGKLLLGVVMLVLVLMLVFVIVCLINGKTMFMHQQEQNPSMQGSEINGTNITGYL